MENQDIYIEWSLAELLTARKDLRMQLSVNGVDSPDPDLDNRLNLIENEIARR